MDYRKEFYKNARFTSKDRARTLRSEALCKARMENRMSILQSRRNMDEIKTEAPAVSKEQQRAEMLAKWKAEKQKAMAELKKKQKPVFKVGILQRKATGSPLLKMTQSYADKNFLNPQQLSKVNKSNKMNREGVITRAKARALVPEKNIEQENRQVSSFSQVVNNKKKQIKKHTFTVPKSVSDLARALKITIPQSPQVLKNNKRNFRVKINESVDILQEKDSHKMDNVQFLPSLDNEEKKENMVPDEIKQSTEKALVVKENKSEPSHEFVPIHYSPFVCKTRGSLGKSPRKSKINLTLDVDELIEKDENELKCRIFSFRKYIEGESKKLLEASAAWKVILKNGPKVPEDVEEEILSLCGKTTLLTSDKFMQFKDLIDKCEKKDPMVKVEDLQGYQDWVSIEVESLDRAFYKLEERKANNWKIEKKEIVKIQMRKEKQPLQAKKAIKPQGIRSNIREHIQAARKLKQNSADMSSLNKLDTWIQAKTPQKHNSLLKEVLDPEAKTLNTSSRMNLSLNRSGAKQRNSGLEIIAATQLARTLTPGKTPTASVVKDQTITLNESLTPLKSILKQVPASPSVRKSSAVQFRIGNSGRKNGTGLNERYFEPLLDDDDCSELPIKMGNFSLTSPMVGKKKNYTSTPIRRSERLAHK